MGNGSRRVTAAVGLVTAVWAVSSRAVATQPEEAGASHGADASRSVAAPRSAAAVPAPAAQRVSRDLPAHAAVAAALQRFMGDAAAAGFTGAVLVARGDTVLLAQGYGPLRPGGNAPITPDAVLTTGSITKQFTAAAILKLEMQGKLSVQDPIGRHLDAVPADKQSITLHHLLTHSAGFPGAIGDDFERIDREAYVRRALDTPLLFAPGTRYEYSNVGYSLLAAIVERVSQSGYERFLHDALFAPAGMRDTGYLLPQWAPERLVHGIADDGGDWGTLVERAIGATGPGWNLLGNGGIHATVHDMWRWHRALSGDAILAAAAKSKMYAPHIDEGGGTWYGYGWSIEPTDWGTLITHNGGNPYFFADFLRFPDSDVVVYYATNSRDRRMRRLARPLARIVFTAEVPPLPAPAPQADVGPAPPPAPPGSLAAKWGLPGGTRSQRAAELLEAIATTDDAWRRQFLAEAGAPALLERRGIDGLASALEMMRQDLGPFRVVRTLRTETGITVVLDTAGSPTQLEIGMEAAPPHRIVAIGLQRGD